MMTMTTIMDHNDVPSTTTLCNIVVVIRNNQIGGILNATDEDDNPDPIMQPQMRMKYSRSHAD